MTGPIPVREFGSVAEMQAHYRDLSSRCFAPRGSIPTRRADVRTVVPPGPYVGNEPALKSWAPPVVYERLCVQTPAQMAGRAAISGHDALRLTVEVTGFSRIDLCGKRKGPSLCKARHIGFWLAIAHAGRSTPQAGHLFGDRDHTTALHGHRRVQAVIRALALALPEDARAAATVLWAADWPSSQDLGIAKPGRR